MADDFAKDSNQSSHFNESVEKSLDSKNAAVCVSCKRPWVWPRNLAYTHMPDDIPNDIKPSTTETIVPYVSRVPGSQPCRPSVDFDLFSKIRFTHAQPLARFYDKYIGNLPNRLVTEFEYNKENGDVYYDIGLQENENNGFATLVTLNSWWNRLFASLLKASGVILALQSDMMYIFSSFNLHKEEHSYTFLFAFIAALLISIAVSSWQAKKIWEIESNARVGDLVATCGWLDKFQTFAALVSFIFFGLEDHVIQIVTKLHPWKSVQPFAAFKSECHRAFIVGYKDECLFRVDNRRGHFFTLPVLMLNRGVMFGIKVYVLYYYDWDWALFAAIVAGVPSVFGSLVDFLLLFLDRRRLKRKLLRTMKNRLSQAPTEENRREKAACAKLLKLHFGIKLGDEAQSEQNANASDNESESHTKCAKCGRVDWHKPCRSDPLKIGDQVTISKGFMEMDDTARGPLKAGQVGEVADVGPFREHLGRNVFVRALGGSWWYNQIVLEKVDTKGPSSQGSDDQSCQHIIANKHTAGDDEPCATGRVVDAWTQTMEPSSQKELQLEVQRPEDESEVLLLPRASIQVRKSKENGTSTPKELDADTE